MEPLLKGLIIGFSIAAPVGPVGLLCIQRTLNYGRLSGLLTGLGAATADGLYGAIAAFGLTLISNFFVAQRFWLGLIGGVFLFYLGLRTFTSRPAEQAAAKAHKGLVYDYISTVLLTLANPATILAFVAIFAGLGLGSTEQGVHAALVMTVGVTLGSALWWFLLSGGISLFRQKLKPSALAIVNRISGIIIVAFALYALISSIHLLKEFL